MDYLHTRCSTCYKHFCCGAHRKDHENKHHFKVVLHKTQIISLNIYKAYCESSLQADKTHQGRNFRALHILKTKSELNLLKRTLTEVNRSNILPNPSGALESRHIVMATRKSKIVSPLPRNFNEADTNKVTHSPVIGTDSHETETDKGVKTSTPIYNTQTMQTPEIAWHDGSVASTVSEYHTPGEVFITDDKVSSGQSKFFVGKGLAVITPLRGIISKTSKYNSSEGDFTPNTDSSKMRHVTFSFNSCSSTANSSPLDSVKEIASDEEIEQEIGQENEQENKQENEQANGGEKENTCSEKIEQFSSSSCGQKGFFNCVAAMFSTAVQSIPSLAPWCTSNDINTSTASVKRFRSPDKTLDLMAVRSPDHKRPCYQCDLMENPIRARRSLSAYNTSKYT